ncbi:MAG: hypothetical protein VX777_01685 [Chlamydiota bacterium]|nr:hypothetical protein [Chlamydiota bacterium]
MFNKQSKQLYNFLHLPRKKLNLPTSTKRERPNLPKDLIINYQSPTEPEVVISEPIVSEVDSTIGFNELLVSQLDNLPQVNRFFNLPIAKVSDKNDNEIEITIEQSNCIGTYSELIRQAELQGITKNTLDYGLDKLSAQKYALLQLMIKAEDAHGGNIIILQDLANHLVPISIEFGRCLGHDPNDERMLPRTTRWEDWPALSEPVEDEIKDFILSLDSLKLVKDLKMSFYSKYDTKLTENQKDIFEIKFDHLHSNILMLQESIKSGLTFRQMIALILPKIDPSSFNFVTQGVLEGGELWPARKRFASLITGFRSAWNHSIINNKLNQDEFVHRIRGEIEEIKKLSETELEEYFFKEICFELRRGLFL